MTDFRSKLIANSQKLRSQMPVVANYAYFDHAAVSPLPIAAKAAIERWVGEAHASGDFHWMRWHREAEETRLACAKIMNAGSDEVALVPSTTFGVNLVASGLPWQPGDSMIVPENEFPSNSLAWRMLKDRQVDVRRVPAEPSGEVKIDRIFEQADHSTKLIAVSWVGYLTGFRINLSALIERAHQRNIQVFVDAIQGLGAFPLDVSALQIDYLAADGHKWMLGPEGAGLFYVAKRNLERIAPQMIGWNSVVGAGDFKNENMSLKPSASRFEGGTTNMVGMMGFGASVKTLLDCGAHCEDSGFSHAILEMAGLAEERLRSIGAIVERDYPDANQSGIISFRIPGEDSMSVRSRCVAQNVILSVRHDKLRIAVHGYNDESDVDRLVRAIQDK